MKPPPLPCLFVCFFNPVLAFISIELRVIQNITGLYPTSTPPAVSLSTDHSFGLPWAHPYDPVVSRSIQFPKSTMVQPANGDHDHPLFVVKETPGAGRGAFATQDLPAGTIIYTANDLTAHVLCREYRGEVCWECFAYNHGKKLPIRDPAHGFAFCSLACASASAPRNDPVSLQAWAVVEATLKAKTRREQVQVGYDEFKPTVDVVNTAWALAEGKAKMLLDARAGGAGAGTKASKHALQQALLNPQTLLLDTLTFQVHSILARYHYPSRWGAILTLEDDPCPYTSFQELHGYISAFLYLVASLPVELLSLVTPSTLRVIKGREVHNSFGIRSLEDEGSEFFGYGVWPSASYFNHSCEPNVLKVRVGRTWVFEAERAVKAGEELQISYLGAPGEEKILGRQERRRRLERTWGFGCVCHRCEVESGDVGSGGSGDVDSSPI